MERSKRFGGSSLVTRIQQPNYVYPSCSPTLPPSVVLVLTGRNIDSDRLDNLRRREWTVDQKSKVV